VTEAKWLSCTDPEVMLRFMSDQGRGRKWRLYLCGGCRSIHHLFYLPESLAAVEVVERFADGKATEHELARSEWNAEIPAFGYELNDPRYKYSPSNKATVVPRLVEIGALPESALSGSEWEIEQQVRERLIAAAELAEFAATSAPSDSEWGYRRLAEVGWPGRWLADCVFGNPFRPSVVDASWLSWEGSTVPRLAQGIYDERAFDRLPILGDALEEAGCTDADVLGHCRSEGPHTRGCWVVDLILGKE
jgi:hypothetical protein